MTQNINWVQALGPKGPARLKYEKENMKKQYPQFDFHADPENPNVLCIDGFIITQLENAYHLRIYFPENYPYAPPLPVILDPDILNEYQDKGFPHTRGSQKGGVALCVIKPDDTIGQPWTPKLSSLAMVKFAATWLQAYELWKETKEWHLREA